MKDGENNEEEEVEEEEDLKISKGMMGWVVSAVKQRTRRRTKLTENTPPSSRGITFPLEGKEAEVSSRSKPNRLIDWQSHLHGKPTALTNLNSKTGETVTPLTEWASI